MVLWTFCWQHQATPALLRVRVQYAIRAPVTEMTPTARAVTVATGVRLSNVLLLAVTVAAGVRLSAVLLLAVTVATGARLSIALLLNHY